jgi:hypothetical protein
MKRKLVSVQADHTYIDRVEEVAQGLREAGMAVRDQIPPLGHFRGVADADKVERLKGVPGVAVVEVTGDEGDAEQDEYSIGSGD